MEEKDLFAMAELTKAFATHGYKLRFVNGEISSIYSNAIEISISLVRSLDDNEKELRQYINIKKG